jgi:chromosome segregation ATPase
MKTFNQFLESHQFHLGEIDNLINDQKRKISNLVEKNSDLIRALAKIKTDLERALKDKSKLNDAVYGAINIARNLTPYSSDYGLSHKIDDPLSDSEKTL